MSYQIEIRDQGVQDMLQRLLGRVTNLSPFLQALGEDMVARTKARFASATAPDGSPWKPNAPATIAAYVRARGGKISKKSGTLNKQGQILAASKRPLQGLTGDLEDRVYAEVTGNSLFLGNGAAYAAIQQRGGQAGVGGRVTIPARPFFPVTASDELYASERDLVIATLARYIEGAGK